MGQLPFSGKSKRRDDSPKCPFCPTNELYAYQEIFSLGKDEVIIDETEHFILLPDIAPIVEGHLLVIPKRHVSCFGEIILDDAEELESMKSGLQHYYDYECQLVFFEHGNSRSKGGPASLNHAHMHCFPLPYRIIKKIVERVHWDNLLNRAELYRLFKQDKPYLYMSSNDKEYFFEINNLDEFPTQFVRCFIIAQYGKKFWNWSLLYHNKEFRKHNMEIFMRFYTKVKLQRQKEVG